MKTKTPKQPIKATSVWTCCEHPETAMSFEELLAHAKEVHGLYLKGKKCQKKMVLHLDCADSFHSTYEVECEGLKLLNATSNPRHKGDYMSTV